MAKEKKTLEEIQKEKQAEFAANEARANSVWAPEDISVEDVAKAGNALEEDEKAKATEIAIENLNDQDLVAARNNAQGSEKQKFQDEINKRNSDGKEHFWQAEDKALKDKRDAEAKAKLEAEEKAKADAEAKEGMINFEGKSDENIYNTYVMMKRQGGDPEVLAQFEAEMEKRGMFDDGKPDTFDSEQAKNAVSPENQEAAMSEFADATGEDPTVKNAENAVGAANKYAEKYGGVTINKVTHPDGSVTYEAIPKPVSFIKYSKENGGIGATLALAALTISSVAATLVTASIADPAVPIIPPINFSAFDPNLVGYKAYKNAVIGLADDINKQNAEAWGEAAKAKTNIGNKEDLGEDAKDTGERNLNKELPTMEKEQELTKDMETFKLGLEKEMAKYKNELAKELKKVDADIQKQIITYMTNNEIDKAKKLASEVGADPKVLNNLDKAIKATSGNLHMNDFQKQQIITGYINTAVNTANAVGNVVDGIMPG